MDQRLLRESVTLREVRHAFFFWEWGGGGGWESCRLKSELHKSNSACISRMLNRIST